jgi:hypothetical protein
MTSGIKVTIQQQGGSLEHALSDARTEVCCMMKGIHRWVLAGVIAATMCGPAALEAQAFDSLGRPRPLTPMGPTPRDSTRHIIYCGVRDPSGMPVAYRIIGADGQLLFMSSVDTASAARATEEASALGGVDPSRIASIEVVKGAEVEKTYGRSYANGLIVVTLDRQGTEAWLSAASARGAKPGAAPPPP